MSDSDSIVDLLVFGGGMAGMSAAARACSDGASVVLVEKAPAIGGSAMYAGFIWTAPTVEVMREVNRDGDPALSARVVEDYADALDWVRSLGVHGRRPGHRARLRPRSARPTWPTTCWPASGWCASDGERARPVGRAQRLLFEDGAVGRRRDRGRRGRAARDPRALDAAGDRRLRRRSATCARSTSTRWRATCRCARTRTASVTGCGSACRSEPRSDRRTPASTGT